jgi:hypothetical protein
VQTPDRQRQVGRASASPRPRTDRRWVAVPIAFLAGAVLAVTLLLAVNGPGAATAQRKLVAPATTPSTSQSAQVLQLLADEAREAQAVRLQRLRAKDLLIAAHAAAQRRRAVGRQGRARRSATTHASGGTKAPAHTSRPQSSRSPRRSGAREPKTREHAQHAHRGSSREEHEATAKRHKQETAERRRQHARAKEEKAAARHDAKATPSREAATP